MTAAVVRENVELTKLRKYWSGEVRARDARCYLPEAMGAQTTALNPSTSAERRCWGAQVTTLWSFNIRRFLISASTKEIPRFNSQHRSHWSFCELLVWSIASLGKLIWPEGLVDCLVPETEPAHHEWKVRCTSSMGGLGGKEKSCGAGKEEIGF